MPTRGSVKRGRSTAGGDDPAAKEKWSATPFKGMLADLKRRSEHYVDDWTAGFSSKVLSSTLFMCVTAQHEHVYIEWAGGSVPMRC